MLTTSSSYPALQSLTLRSLEISDRSEWELFLKAFPDSSFMQSWAWSVFKELEGYQSLRYGIFEQEILVGGTIFYYYRHSHRANLLFAPGAPCLLPGYEQQGIALLLHQAQKLAAQLGAIALRIEPMLREKPTYLHDFVRAPVDLIPSETLLIDLQLPEAEILAQMKPKCRYNIRLSQRHGVETNFTTNEQAIPTLYDIFWETSERQQFFAEPYGFFINLCQTLFQEKLAEIGLAHYQGEVLAAILLIHWGDRTTYLYGGHSQKYPQVMASYAIHWAALQRAKQRGSKFYDFYGFTQNPNHSYAKFSQFKQKFGGEIVTIIGAHDYFFYDLLADILITVFNQIART
jgi:lipid II:glycine glycyltransferase (peptidoglycan interpeptide bridge formation enzyme)